MKQSDLDWLVSELVACVDEIDRLIALDAPDGVSKEVERLERTVREFRKRAGI